MLEGFDFLGQKLEIGEKVLFVDPKHNGLRIGKVKDFKELGTLITSAYQTCFALDLEELLINSL